VDWLSDERGKGLLWEESRLVSKALDAVFGDYFLQIGAWGPADAFIKSARTRSRYLVATELGKAGNLVMNSAHLGIASGSIDAILLPHTLETSNDPHQLLREIDRILRPDGHLIVLGFNAPAWWSVRQRLSDGEFLPGIDRFVGEHRLVDWLQLLGFRTTKSHFYHPAKAVDRVLAGAHEHDSTLVAEGSWWRKSLLRRPAEQRGMLRIMRGWRYWRLTSACYMVVARKEVITMTPIRQPRFTRPRLVGGLVNPSASRSTRVIPLDRR
jgi:SAM-dependent methyltransferase